jgi:parvulin-like peptidyl-prolyl isomerase
MAKTGQPATRQAPDDETWRTVDGQPILRSQVMQLLPPARQGDLRAQRQAAEALTDWLLAIAPLTADQRAATQSQLDTAAREEVRRSGGVDGWHAQLAARGQTAAAWRLQQETAAALDVQLAAEASAAVDDTALRQRYEKRPGRYQTTERVQLREWAVPLPATADAAQLQVARQRLEAIQQAGEAGTSDRGWTTPGDLDPVLAKALATLQPGQRTGVLSTAWGLHVLQLLAREPSRQLTLDEARPVVEAHLRAERQVLLRRARLQALRERAKMTWGGPLATP